MVINFCTIPSNRSYGFEGVSEEEFAIYMENVFDLIALTPLKFITETDSESESSAYLWADKDRKSFYVTKQGYRTCLEPVLAADDVNDIGEQIYALFLDPKYDMFNHLSQTEKDGLAQAIIKMLE